MFSLSDFTAYTGQAVVPGEVVLTWCKADGYMFKKHDPQNNTKIVAVDSKHENICPQS